MFHTLFFSFSRGCICCNKLNDCFGVFDLVSISSNLIPYNIYYKLCTSMYMSLFQIKRKKGIVSFYNILELDFKRYFVLILLNVFSFETPFNRLNLSLIRLIFPIILTVIFIGLMFYFFLKKLKSTFSQTFRYKLELD